jgi:hypothetical protein
LDNQPLTRESDGAEERLKLILRLKFRLQAAERRPPEGGTSNAFQMWLFANEGEYAMIGAHFQDSSKPYKSDHKI